MTSNVTTFLPHDILMSAYYDNTHAGSYIKGS